MMYSHYDAGRVFKRSKKYMKMILYFGFEVAGATTGFTALGLRAGLCKCRGRSQDHGFLGTGNSRMTADDNITAMLF